MKADYFHLLKSAFEGAAKTDPLIFALFNSRWGLALEYLKLLDGPRMLIPIPEDKCYPFSSFSKA